MAWVDDLCPMSDEAAKRLTKTTDDFNEYICPSCKRFRISHSALETLRLQNPTKDDRIEILMFATRLAGHDKLPFISKIPRR